MASESREPKVKVKMKGEMMTTNYSNPGYNNSFGTNGPHNRSLGSLQQLAADLDVDIEITEQDNGLFAIAEWGMDDMAFEDVCEAIRGK